MFVQQLIIIASILFGYRSENQYYRIPPHDISALIGSNVTIPCVLSLPHGDVQWTKDGLALGYERNLSAFPSWSIIGDENRGEFNFFIQSLKLEDEGLFACEVSPYGDAIALKQIAHIRTLVPPKTVEIVEQKKIFQIKYDDQISQIDCHVNGARPAAHIQWLNETGYEYPATSRVFPQKDQLFSTISTLTLVPALLLNQKRFTCQVQHETLIENIHHLQTTIEIQIIYPPDRPMIISYSSTNRLSNGSYLTLSCRAFGGNPLGYLTWYRIEDDHLNFVDNSTTEIKDKNFVENNISMIIQPSDNNRTFSCQVNNDYLRSIGENLQMNITLSVDFGPSFVDIQNKDLNETVLIEGTPRRFICRTSSSNPRAILTWKLDNQTISSDIDPSEESGEYAGQIVQSTKTIGLDQSLRSYHKKILSCEGKNPQTGQLVIDSTPLNVIFDATNIEMQGLTSNQMIQSGDKVTVDCILNGGNPLGKILWYKDDKLLSSTSYTDVNGTYLLSRVEFIANESDHNLLLTCQGQVERFPQKLASFLLNITFLPDEIMIMGNSIFSNLTLDQTYSDIFECRTSVSNPQMQLTIYRVTKSGEKHFDLQYRTPSVYLDRMNTVQFMLPLIDLSFHENILICEAMLDTDQTRFIKQINYTLYVNHKPYFEELNSSYHILENQSLNVTFNAHAYPLPISYSWFHPSDRQLMNDQLNIFIKENQLSLKNLQRQDQGVYRCIATNAIGSIEINFTLEMLYGPMITRTQGYTLSDALLPDSSARLLCVIDAHPLDLNNIRWYKDEQEISIDQWERRIEGKEVTLIRQSIERTDAGEYLCEVENSLGKSRATIPLFVQYPPEIDKTQDKLAVDSERFRTAEFHCSISSLPKPNITWFKDNQLLSISSKYQFVVNNLTSSVLGNVLFDAVLSVLNITKADYGIYQCKAENPLGNDFLEITLTGITIPDPPNQIELHNLSHSSVTITWQPGFNGGAEQTFQLRYRQSTVKTYFYENLPNNSLVFHLKNLKLASEYYLNLRSNNSYHLSPWSDQITIKTSSFFPTITFHLTKITSQNFPFNIISIIALIGFGILLINILLIVYFVCQRRKTNVNNENLSTTDTNETETNTVDLFQPIPSSFFTVNTYQKYDEEEDMQKPFVSSTNLSPLDKNDTQKDTFAPYDNLRLHQYYPTNFNNHHHHVTYRSFKTDLQTPMETHQYIRAELV